MHDLTYPPAAMSFLSPGKLVEATERPTDCLVLAIDSCVEGVMDASDVLVERLMEWGVDTIFGLPGDGINGVFEALRKQKDRIRFIHVRHEEAAAFMACAYAKFTGRLGVCIATSGPGGIHLLNGLYDAKMDGSPVLAITGLQHSDLIGTLTQQDVALDKLFMDVAVYNERVMSGAHMESVADLAIRTALTKRGVAHITIPVDVQIQEMKKGRSSRNPAHHTSAVPAYFEQLPARVELEHAADILNRGKKIAILAGQGALHATQELEDAAEILGAPVVKALLGKAAVPDNSPYTTGGIGLLGTEPSQDAIKGCDTLFIVGSSFPYIEFLPEPGSIKCVQIELDPQRVSLRHPADVALVGDTKTCLRALIPMLKKHDKAFLKKAQEAKAEWQKLMEERGTRDDKPMKPQVLGWELGKRIPSNAIVTSDSGTITTWWARYVPALRGQKHSCSGNLATMACGLPYAIAAAVAYPDRPVYCIIGDGGLSMLLGELITVAAYKLNIKIIVIKNNTLGQIKWEQMVFLGNPEYACDLQPADFVTIARGAGIDAIQIDDPTACGTQLDGVIKRNEPVLIEAVVDQFTPPMPAKVKASQALKLAEALARGEPNRMKIVLTNAHDKVRELV
ncbi:thiamine pyrophosphate-dependent enzyme [Alloacidobacterium sp.]|uniref:thiamine pyrophosphate-dependent enzyme n=1 Tax=Alloacidobacterium sp. TaxID=2951999 RepID=UPI002D60E905|nr:thiamine pyrophosphate-dependent enzyme [Alloacidobacterium sp.]HYK36527.1 thiamine pyrophosphate-dependent enzyme [Alloacidobacterium sp.]